ncbi:hypothetical protein ACQY0O_004403 [Thecaphora frezii]
MLSSDLSSKATPVRTANKTAPTVAEARSPAGRKGHRSGFAPSVQASSTLVLVDDCLFILERGVSENPESDTPPVLSITNSDALTRRTSDRNDSTSSGGDSLAADRHVYGGTTDTDAQNFSSDSASSVGTTSEDEYKEVICPAPGASVVQRTRKGSAPHVLPCLPRPDAKAMRQLTRDKMHHNVKRSSPSDDAATQYGTVLESPAIPMLRGRASTTGKSCSKAPVSAHERQKKDTEVTKGWAPYGDTRSSSRASFVQFEMVNAPEAPTSDGGKLTQVPAPLGLGKADLCYSPSPSKTVDWDLGGSRAFSTRRRINDPRVPPQDLKALEAARSPISHRTKHDVSRHRSPSLPASANGTGRILFHSRSRAASLRAPDLPFNGLDPASSFENREVKRTMKLRSFFGEPLPDEALRTQFIPSRASIRLYRSLQANETVLAERAMSGSCSAIEKRPVPPRLRILTDVCLPKPTGPKSSPPNLCESRMSEDLSDPCPWERFESIYFRLEPSVDDFSDMARCQSVTALYQSVFGKKSTSLIP